MKTNGKAPLIVISAGGTGGHMFPAQALARLLIERGWRVALFTDKRGKDFGPDLAEVETHRLAAGALLGTGLWQKARAGLSLLRGSLQARRLLKSGEAIGRKLDFLTQEFVREANTLCSKSSSTALTRIGLELKAAIERLKEQSANVE